jgi:hypothetical protein
MSLTTTHMVTLANDSSLSHNHSTHHGVGLSVLLSVLRQLKAAMHIFFVLVHYFFIYLLFYLFTF